MSHRITFLWTVPRSVSTSFERMMSERGDHTVLDEPFSRSYYFGPDRRSPRFTETLPQSSVKETLQAIETASPTRRPAGPTSTRRPPSSRTSAGHSSCSTPTCSAATPRVW